jgi:tripartite-type tricarboxylate transporter receptor subunit TctC
MPRKILFLCGAAASVSLFCPGLVFAQAGQPFPGKLLRIVAPPPGSNVDLIARVVAQNLPAVLGQPVVVENRPDLIAIENVVRATPDGYTSLFYTSAVWIKPLLQKVDYDPVKDLIPISLTTAAPTFLFANAGLPVKSVRDLIALAKAKPGQLNYGIAGHGTSGHLAMELLKNMAGIDIVTIAYKGSGAVVTATLANQVQVSFSSASTILPHVATGRLRILGVASATPSVVAPDVPTIASTGLPGYDVRAEQCMWVPGGTPRPVVAKLSEAVQTVLRNEEVKKRLLSDGTETVGFSSEQTVAYIRKDIARWSKLVKAANLRAE